MSDPDGKRAFVIVGEMGVGKSAIAAHFSQIFRDKVLGIHFCTSSNTRTLQPYVFVNSLISKLAARLNGYSKAIADKRPEDRRDSASDAFRELIVDPTRGMPPPPQPWLIIIDSLDEAEIGRSGETILDVLVNQAEDLPGWLRILTTTRPEEAILRKIRQLNSFELNAERPENLADVADYVAQRLRQPALAVVVREKAPAVATRILHLAAGNYLYAQSTLEALEDGTFSVADLGRLSHGMADFYGKVFDKKFPDTDAYARDFLPILKALAVAMGPLPLDLLRRITGVEPESLQRRLRMLKPVLKAHGFGDASRFAVPQISAGLASRFRKGRGPLVRTTVGPCRSSGPAV